MIYFVSKITVPPVTPGTVYCFILRVAFNLMCTVYFVLAIVLANSYTVYCLLFLKTVNSTKITVQKKTVPSVIPESPTLNPEHPL